MRLIHEHVQHSSVVFTDEWKGYIPLKSEGYIHETVNHSQNFVNPNTGYNIQSIERDWDDSKVWMERPRGPKSTLQSHLTEVSRRNLHKNENLFLSFLINTIAVHST